MQFLKLTAAIAQVARFDGRHADPGPCGLCVAHKQALRAYAEELLPAVLGGEWKVAKGGA
jgi:hypothetical protein